MENKNMGEVIAELRRQHHMTQADLAAKMGVTDKAVSKWERNLSRPDVDSLPLLAETLHTTVETLLTSQSPAKKSPAPALLHTILLAIPLAMGVAAFVCSLLGEIDLRSLGGMLGLGLACLGIAAFLDKKPEK